MICYFCKGIIEEGVTTHFTDVKSCIIAIKNVPCYKCAQCGEIGYSLKVGERLEQITSNLRNTITEVAIINYSVA